MYITYLSLVAWIVDLLNHWYRALDPSYVMKKELWMPTSILLGIRQGDILR